MLPTWVAGQARLCSALLFTNDGTDHAYVSIPGAGYAHDRPDGRPIPGRITAWAYESSDGTGNFVAELWTAACATDGGNAFYFDSGAIGDAEMYTWSELNTAMADWLGRRFTRLAPFWINGCIGRIVYDGTTNLTISISMRMEGAQGGMSSMPVTSPLAFPGYTWLHHDRLGTRFTSGSDNWNGMLDDVAILPAL
jgi:hypothetical protein